MARAIPKKKNGVLVGYVITVDGHAVHEVTVKEYFNKYAHIERA